MKKLLFLLLVCISINTLAQHPCIPPVVSITGADVKCKGEKDTLYLAGPGGTTYVWDNGSTNTFYYTGDIEADSTFYVVATNGGCSDTTYFTVGIWGRSYAFISPPAWPECPGSDVLLIASSTGIGPFTYSWSPGGQTTDTITVNPTTPTSYSVTIINGCGNSAAKSTTVTPDNPTMSLCCNAIILAGHDTLLVANGSVSDILSFQWSPSVTCLNPPLCDSVQVSPSVTTTYTVTGTDSLGCHVERYVTINVGPAAVPSISGTDFINIYPNPSSTAFTIDLPVKAQIMVCDITGRLLFSEMENAGKITFGKELNPGMYFLFIDGKPGVKVVKL